MSEIQDIIELLVKFRDERDWKKFHNSKDLALALSIEAAELNEIFLWKNNDEVNIERLKEELADVFAYAFLIAEKHNLDVKKIVTDKISSNAAKYPIDIAKGRADKYDQLG